MAKLVFVLHERQDTSVAEFRSHRNDTHASIVAKLPNLKGYVQNHTGSFLKGHEGKERLILAPVSGTLP